MSGRNTKHSIIYKCIAVWLFICNVAVAQKSGDDNAMMDKCKSYVESYKPAYISGTDTLVVSMIPMPPADINKFLFDCIKKGNFKPLKFSCVIFIKQRDEYMKVNHKDYTLNDTSYAHNGFVMLLVTAANIDDVGLALTADVCEWITKNAKHIDDYDYVKQFIKK